MLLKSDAMCAEMNGHKTSGVAFLHDSDTDFFLNNKVYGKEASDICVYILLVNYTIYSYTGRQKNIFIPEYIACILKSDYTSLFSSVSAASFFSCDFKHLHL